MHTLAKAIWDKWAPPQWLAVRWDSVFRRAAWGEIGWRNATDPLAVAAVSMMSFGWTSTKPFSVVTAEGRALDLRQTCPATIRAMAHRDIDLKLRKDMAENDVDLRNGTRPDTMVNTHSRIGHLLSKCTMDAPPPRYACC